MKSFTKNRDYCVHSGPLPRQRTGWQRWLLLLLLVIAFGRVQAQCPIIDVMSNNPCVGQSISLSAGPTCNLPANRQYYFKAYTGVGLPPTLVITDGNTDTQFTTNNPNWGNLNGISCGGTYATPYMATGTTRYFAVIVRDPATGLFYNCSQVIPVTGTVPTASITLTENSGVAPNDGTICQGDAATLTANAGGTGYLWSTGATTPSINVTMAGTYTVTVTTGGPMCTASATSGAITVLPLAAVPANRSICRDATPVNLLTWVPGALSFSGPGVTGNTFTPSAVPAATVNAIIEVTFPCNVTGTSSNKESFVVAMIAPPKANLKETLLDCRVPGDVVDLSVMFDGSNTDGGTFTQTGGTAVTLMGSDLTIPPAGGCFTFRYVAGNPDGCPNTPYQDEDQMLITILQDPSFAVTGPGNLVCSGGADVAITITNLSNGQNPVLTINGAPASFGAVNLAAPASAGSIIYDICYTESSGIPAACGSSLPGAMYEACSKTVCQRITVYNDGNDCGANSPFDSECPANLEASDPCPVSVDPSLDLECSFFSLSGPDLIEATLTPQSGIVTCVDEEICLDWKGSLPGELGDAATGGPTLSEINTATEVICAIITFEFCIDLGFTDICIDPIPLGEFEDYCDQTIGQVIFGLLGDLLGGDGGGGLIVADTDGDGSFDYVAHDYVFPASSTDSNQDPVCIPNNVKTPQGTITVRNVVAWPFAPESACGTVSSEEINLLELLPIGAIPLVGIIIEDLLAAASCNVNLVFSDEETVEIPVLNTEEPRFANCNDTGYIFSEDFACNTEANWSIPVVYDGCFGTVLPYRGRTAGTDDTQFNGTASPVIVVTESGVYQTEGPVPGSELAPGTYTVTYTAYSCSGVSSTCSFPVVVTTGNPVLACPANMTIETDVDQCQAIVTGLTPIRGVGCASVINYAVDYPAASGFADVATNTPYSAANQGTHNNPSGLPFPQGETTITYTMMVDEDGDGSISASEIQECSFTVTVVDAQEPVATCVDVEIQLDNTGSATVFAVDQLSGQPFIDGGSSDNCDDTPVIEIQKPGGAFAPFLMYDCSETGNNFVNLRITDEDDNTRTCLARVKVKDFFEGIQYAMALPEVCLEANNPSQFDFTNYLTITLPNGTTLNHNQVANNSYLGDAVGGFGITAFAPASGSTLDPGSISQDGIYTPGTGSGFVTISYAMALPGATIPQNGNLALAGCFDITHTTFELRQPLNMASPECECVDVDERIVDLGVVSGGLEPYRIQYSGVRLDVDGDGVEEDVDGIYTYDAAHGHDITDFQQDLGELRVVYTQPVWSFTIIDARGCEIFRSGSCDNDDLTEGPQITCPPSNHTLTTEEYLCESQYDWTHPLPTDNCAVVLYDYRIVNPDGTIEGPFNLNALLNTAPGAPLTPFFDATYEFQLGLSTVTYYAEDAQGNFISCSFQITVRDDDPPHFINCPYPPVVQNAEDNHCDAYVDFALPLATDNCDIPLVHQIDNSGLTTGDRFPVGTTIMYWEAVDLAGNRDTCQVKVIVNDYWQTPLLDCPANVEQDNDLWLCGAQVFNIAPEVEGPCENNYGITYTIYADEALTITKDCGVNDASGEFFDVGSSWVKYTVQNQPLLMITEVTQSGAVDRIEIANLGPADLDISCLEVKRVAANVAANQTIGPVTQLPSLAPSVLPVGGVRVFDFAFNGAANMGACYTISYMGTTFDEVATNGYAACTGFTGTLAGGDVIRKCEADTDRAADWVLAENCYPLTVGAMNPDLEVMPDNGTQTSLQSIEPNVVSCVFKVTVIDAEDPFCGKLTNNTTYNGPAIAAISPATCNRSTITVPAGNCIIGDIVFNRTGTATPANSTMTLISPKGIKLVVTEIPDDSLRTLFGQKAEGVWTLDIVPNAGQTPTLTGWSLTINCLDTFDLADQVLTNDPGECGADFSWIHPYFVDNCFQGTISVAYTTTDADCVPTGGQLLDIGGYAVTKFFCVGTTTVTYTLTDAAGNVEHCGFDVTVNDEEDPIVTCPQDIIIQLDGGECGRFVSYSPAAVSDNCAVVDTVMVPASGSWFDIGLHTVSITIYDEAGNSDVCTFTVNIIEHVPTSGGMICNDLSNVSIDASCVFVLDADAALEGDDYHCYSDYTIIIKNSLNQTVGNTFNATHIGQTFNVTVLDPETGNSCWGTLTLEDKLKPELTCPANITIACSESTAIAHTGNVTIKDCSATTTQLDEQIVDNGECGTPRQIITRSFIVTDVWGNQAACSHTITVTPFNLAAVVFPADITVDCESAYLNPNATAPVTTGRPAINGAAIGVGGLCSSSISKTDEFFDICTGSYTIHRTWKVSNECLPLGPNNPIIHVQRIRVKDFGGPAFACPGNVTVSVDAESCCATAALPDMIITEGCSQITNLEARVTGIDPSTGNITTFTVPGTLADFPGNNYWNADTLAVFPYTQCLPIGAVYTVKYTAKDGCENTSTCQFTMTIQDLVPPVTACDEWTQVGLGLNGTAFVDAISFDDGSYDNCAPVHFKARRMDVNACQTDTVFHDQVKFCCSDINDTINVILRVYDVDPGTGVVSIGAYEGHYNDCMVQVLVEDKIKPICTAPANVTVTCELFDPSLWAYGTATGTDNCCVDTITGTINYSQFDSLCNRGTITRNWTVKDCAANTANCSQKVIVQYNQEYYVKFPNDRVISVCDGTGTYGAPTFFGEDCELLATSFVDEVFTVVPDACFKIERTWTVINWCTYTPNAPCTYVPNPDMTNGPTVSQSGNNIANWAPSNVAVNGVTTNYGNIWSANANCYQYKQIIKIIDTQDPLVVTPSGTEYCDYTTNDANFWNADYWWDGSIQSHNMCEGEADIAITGIDSCSGANISFRYLLFLDLDGNGSMETVVPGSPLPQVYNEVRFDNVNTPLYGGGTPRAFDHRAVTPVQKWGWGISTDTIGGARIAHVRWLNQSGGNAVPQLPYGTHKIKWTIEDGCGNEVSSETTFTVKDCKKPTVVCVNGLSINQMNGPANTVTLWASDFLAYGEDNCTPSPLLKYGIRKSGTGSGFPAVNGVAQTSVTFDCSELGTQLVELWAEDKAGNADFCETYVLIQDNMGVCSQPGMATIAGVLKTEATQGVEDANVELDGVTNGTPMLSQVFTNVGGSYVFSNALPITANATITPTLDADPLNGVNTWDLVLISRHILGLEPLNSPYKLIAADANKSGTVTTFDIVELRKLILGTYNALPNNESWRFIDKAQVFTSNENPFADVIRENLQIANIQASVNNGDFVAAKTGDVDGTATPNNLVLSDDRTAGTLLFDVTDRKVVAGETFTVNFKAADKVAGYQFTMNFNGLEVVGVTPGVGMNMDNFGIFTSATLGTGADAITTSADATEGQFAVTFKATTAGQLSNMLGVSSRITKAVAFTSATLGTGDGNNQLDVAFRFNNGGVSTIAGVGFELYQNAPNPFVNKTVVGFHLPEAAEATLSVYDEIGRVLYTTTGSFAKGYNAVQLDRSLLSANGVLYYKLETVANSATKKMIQTK